MELTFAPNLLVFSPYNQGVHFKKEFRMLQFDSKGL